MIFILPPSAPGQPAYERISAYIDYSKRAQKFTCLVNYPLSIVDKVGLIKILMRQKHREIFVSMPPFRLWWLYLVPGIRIHLDIRDGWSIAMKSGYGGTSRSHPFKAIFARFIERLSIRKACLTITCTPGLQNYLQSVSQRKISLVTNGISDDDFVRSLRLKNSVDKAMPKELRNEIVFCCAGQFSEYGCDKAKLIISTICERYADNNYVIRLIGSDFCKNQWLLSYVKTASNGYGRVEILERMDKQRLYEELIVSDIAIALIRDPFYDFGTKIFDYIALGIPVLNYFSSPNAFTDYFDAVLDKPFRATSKIPEIRRSVLIDNLMGEVRVL